MLSIKSFLAALCMYALLVLTAQAEELPVATPLYPQCPLQLQLDGQSYALDDEDLYFNAIDWRLEVRPDAVPQEYNYPEEPDFWLYETYHKFPFYLKCNYENTQHYLVLELRGAHRCTRGKDEKRMKCE